MILTRYICQFRGQPLWTVAWCEQPWDVLVYTVNLASEVWWNRDVSSPGMCWCIRSTWHRKCGGTVMCAALGCVDVFGSMMCWRERRAIVYSLSTICWVQPGHVVDNSVLSQLSAIQFSVPVCLVGYIGTCISICNVFVIELVTCT